MKKLEIFLKAIAAGMAIGLGTAAYLSCENKVLGAFMFTVGLFTICFFGLKLYTGRIGYILDIEHPIECLIIWLGNALGCVVSGIALRYACPELVNKAARLTESKLDTDLWRLFVLGIFCGILMYIAVHNYNTNPSGFGKCIGVIICVPAFILCGFEHCIANFVYFTMGITSASQLVRIVPVCLVVTVANAVGAVIFRKISTAFKQEKSK